tara:strand:+ start:3271 stop:3738 length:468 start_codon:yes stop_codon:yes gene_type:complete
MASQTDKDTAAAKARQNNNNQAAKDTAAAKDKQNGGDGGTSERMSQREAASELNLAGNNTMSGRTEQPMPTMSEREEAAGLNLDGNDTLSGRNDSFYQFSTDLPGTDEPLDHGVHDQTNDQLVSSQFQGSFSAIICRNGVPFRATISGSIGSQYT